MPRAESAKRRLILVLAVQLAILVAIPARKLIARAVGREITLATVPVDPYSILSGYYVTLAYEVEREAARLEPGLSGSTGEPVYLGVEERTPAWRLVRVRGEPPEETDGLVWIRGSWDGGRAKLDGAERFYIPEIRREEADRALRQAGGRALVDMRVDGSGTPALLRLRAGASTFGGEESEAP